MIILSKLNQKATVSAEQPRRLLYSIILSAFCIVFWLSNNTALALACSAVLALASALLYQHTRKATLMQYDIPIHTLAVALCQRYHWTHLSAHPQGAWLYIDDTPVLLAIFPNEIPSEKALESLYKDAASHGNCAIWALCPQPPAETEGIQWMPIDMLYSVMPPGSKKSGRQIVSPWVQRALAPSRAKGYGLCALGLACAAPLSNASLWIWILGGLSLVLMSVCLWRGKHSSKEAQ